jgi:hypothetical protein
MSKYSPLESKLRSIHFREWPTTFREIENLLGFKLPASAREHRAWWSNNASNSVMTKAWLSAGWQTADVDMSAERLVFRRIRPEPPRPPSGTPDGPASAVPPLFGAMRGSMRVLDSDLTLPTGELWAADQ